jgi:hypothetical protein
MTGPHPYSELAPSLSRADGAASVTSVEHGHAPEQASPAQAGYFSNSLSLGLERALLAAVVIIALGLRLPHLTLVPQFTDESLEVLWSLPIARGESFPLTNYDAYYGALFNYLVAAAFGQAP